MGIIERAHETKLSALRVDKLRRASQKQIRNSVTNGPHKIVDPVTNVERKIGDPVTNLSKYILSNKEHSALVNGLNHVYAPEKLDEPQLICNVEFFYARLLNIQTSYRHYEQKPAAEVIRHQLTSLQLSAASELREKANSFRKVARSELKKIGVENRETFCTIRSLAKNKSLVITRPDKGRGVVVMDRAEYVQKMNTILDDRSAFTLINNDPTLDNEEELVKFLLVLNKEGFISQQEYEVARPSGSRPARIYGLPKLHKKQENYPLRPVMSATKTVAYGLGKMLTNRLYALRSSPYTIKDTPDFVRKIRESKHVNKTMVSFDVKSLFTSVPLTYTIDLILDKMYPTCSKPCDYKQRSRFCEQCKKRRDFERLLRIATSQTHFIFDKKMYVQHNGVAMGAPLAPIIADIFMSHLEETLMDQLKQSGVHEWYRFVDDTFVLIEPKTKVEDLLKILNSFHPSISFTHQTEANDSLAFLDVWVIRPTGSPQFQATESPKFQTAVYRKETYTGLMIKWSSFVPMQYKKSSVVSMIRRALMICTTYSTLAIELENIRQISLHNNYPLSFIDTRIGIGISNFLKRSPAPAPPVNEREKQKMYIEIPYTGAVTDSFKKRLSHIASKLRPELDIHFFARPPPAVQKYFNTKDPIPKCLQSDIVYTVKCKDCKEIYVGETSRQAITRLREHGAPNSLFKEHLECLNNQTNTTLPEDNHNEPPPIRTTTEAYLHVEKTPTIMDTPNPNPETLRTSARLREKKEKLDNTNTTPVLQQLQNNQSSATTTKAKDTSISRHEQQTGHHMDWEDFKVVWQDSNTYKRRLKESLVVQAYGTQLNRTTHSIPMLVFPEGLPRKILPDPDYNK
ncbi:unnamed protein product [Adineta steineri]|uniref:Reverse transcriptase domain-containing protein n=1 Tax=Adineta steineri TaxID=433720 RepID=A0A815UWA3_9BILA|nr:unnamed protein product [Adineta steineri]CAF4075977.1 unnamed protein product [Adineta steineri]